MFKAFFVDRRRMLVPELYVSQKTVLDFISHVGAHNAKMRVHANASPSVFCCCIFRNIILGQVIENASRAIDAVTTCTACAPKRLTHTDILRAKRERNTKANKKRM